MPDPSWQVLLLILLKFKHLGSGISLLAVSGSMNFQLVFYSLSVLYSAVRAGYRKVVESSTTKKHSFPIFPS